MLPRLALNISAHNSSRFGDFSNNYSIMQLLTFSLFLPSRLFWMYIRSLSEILGCSAGES